MTHTDYRNPERGTMLIVVLFVALSIAGLAAISSGRVVAESNRQATLEDETRAFNQAYSQLHIAMNVVNNSFYNEVNHNLVLRSAFSVDGLQGADDMDMDTLFTRLGRRGGAYTASGADLNAEPDLSWMDDPAGIAHGIILGTTTRVYRGRDYVQRLQKLRGETPTAVDPLDLSENYFILESMGRSGDTMRMVACLVRENEPFSSFVFFQNQHTLGVSGRPRGLIHANDMIAFYFPNGQYVDPVSAVNGFDYTAGATTDNTNVLNGNDAATPIGLGDIDFAELKDNANLFVGSDGLDAEILLIDEQVRIREYTPPQWIQVEYSSTSDQLVGYEDVLEIRSEDVQIGTTPVDRTRSVYSHTEAVPYEVMIPVMETQMVPMSRTDGVFEDQPVEYSRVDPVMELVEVFLSREDPVMELQDVPYSRLDPVFETQSIELTRDVAVWNTRTVTNTRMVEIFVPYDPDPDNMGGTSVGGGASGVAGEYEWVEEAYDVQEDYIDYYVTETYFEDQLVQIGTTTVNWTVPELVQVGTTTVNWSEWQLQQTGTVTVTWTVIEPVQIGTILVEWEDPVLVQIGTEPETRYNDVDMYVDEAYVEDVPVYELQDVEYTVSSPIYESVTVTWFETEFQYPALVSTEYIDLSSTGPGSIYIDGRITELSGTLNGRLTIIGNEKVRVTGSIQYRDNDDDTAMINGGDYRASYGRNPDYDGMSVLGVVARTDVLLTNQMPASAEINATLMAVEGRVGISGFQIDSLGEPVQNQYYGLTGTDLTKELAYAATTYADQLYVKDSLRRIGGIISNSRILETYIKPRADGTAYVDSGFKRGRMLFDINLLFNPPPNFVEVPRPVLVNYAPIFLVRNAD